MAGKNRFSEFEEHLQKDYDPEADPASDSDEDVGSDDGAAERAATEHYASVGKSKLRQKEGVSLGPQYRGSRVSRQALEDGSESEQNEESDEFEDAHEKIDSIDSDDAEYDNPETADLERDTARADGDAEIDSDNAFGPSDEEGFEGFVFRGSSTPKDAAEKKRRPKAADFLSSSEDDLDGEKEDEENSKETDEEEDEVGGAGLFDLEAEEEDHSDENGSDEGAAIDSDQEDEARPEGEEEDEETDDEENDSEDDDEEEEDDDEDDDDDDAHGRSKSRSASTREEQRKLMNEGQKALVATISAAAQQDAQKGLAVRQQRKTFDGLLNIRIRLQKALIATNTLTAFDDQADGDAEPYEAAEEAALKLLDTLDTVRASLVPKLAKGEKRKREGADATSTEALSEDLREADARASKYRKKVLENWSNKTNNTTVEVKSRNLISSRQSIISSLEDQLLNSDRLIKRTRTPRSCAPLQVAKKLNEDASVYDDADFYQLLLKELVDQRTSDETSAQAGNASLATVRWAAMKEAKTRKHVDRRASKGRKMRFNIHEQLQNFMAPEDRRSWEQDAIDRLFGTLFGQKMELTEGAGGASDDEMEEANAEEEGLRLFRN